jgi:hypothetical protein
MESALEGGRFQIRTLLDTGNCSSNRVGCRRAFLSDQQVARRIENSDGARFGLAFLAVREGGEKSLFVPDPERDPNRILFRCAGRKRLAGRVPIADLDFLFATTRQQASRLLRSDDLAGLAEHSGNSFRQSGHRPDRCGVSRRLEISSHVRAQVTVDGRDDKREQSQDTCAGQEQNQSRLSG